MIVATISALMFFSIPEGSAAQSLQEFGAQSQLQILYKFTDMETVRTNAIEGSFEPFAALDKMIEGTDIRYVYTATGTLTLTVENSDQPYRIFNGWAYGCMPLDWVAGMLFSQKSDWLAYRIGRGLGWIPDDQMWCTAQRPVRQDEREAPQSIDSEVQIRAPKTTRVRRITWGPRS